MAAENTAPAVYTNPLDFPCVFSFDAETDGLWGEHFAIAAIVLDLEGREVARFAGRVADMVAAVTHDAWVRENIVPLCESLPTFANARELRDAFWAFWMEWKDKALALSDCGYSVEGGLIHKCVEDDLGARNWLAPWPMLDLGTLLVVCGINPRAVQKGQEGSRIMLAGLEEGNFNLHNPVDDALATGLSWLKYLKMARKALGT